MEIKIIPVGTKTASVSRYLAPAIAIIKKKKNIRYALTAMGTIVEGNSIDQLLQIACQMHRAALDAGLARLVTFIELDERRDKKATMAEKVRSLKKSLGFVKKR